MPLPDENTASTAPFIIDGHVDILYEMFNHHPGVAFDKLQKLPLTLDKMKAANVVAVVTAFYCPDTYNGPGTAAPFLKSLIDYAGEFLDGLFHITERAQLDDCLGGGKQAMIWLIENADALIEIEPEILARKGIKAVGLTHMGRNRIGDGNDVRFPGGLRPAGIELVRKLGREGIAFDVAHLAEPGFHDLARIFDGPLLSSHTGVRALCNSPRNLVWDQMRIIFERDGIVGVAADPLMLSPAGDASIEDMFNHIDWIAQHFEAGGIGIGSDFCGFQKINRGMEDISKMPDLADLLLRHGYPETSVRGIMGENWYKLYSRLL